MQLVEVFDATEEELRAELERLKGASDEHGDTERIRQAIHQELLEREASQEVFAALDGNTLSEKPLVSGGVDDKSEEQPSAGAKGEEERGEGRDDDRGEESQRETKDSWNDGEERELQNEAPHASRESMVEFAWQLFEREREAFHKARRHIKREQERQQPRSSKRRSSLRHMQRHDERATSTCQCESRASTKQSNSAPFEASQKFVTGAREKKNANVDNLRKAALERERRRNEDSNVDYQEEQISQDNPGRLPADCGESCLERWRKWQLVIRDGATTPASKEDGEESCSESEGEESDGSEGSFDSLRDCGDENGGTNALEEGELVESEARSGTAFQDAMGPPLRSFSFGFADGVSSWNNQGHDVDEGCYSNGDDDSIHPVTCGHIEPLPLGRFAHRFDS